MRVTTGESGLPAPGLEKHDAIANRPSVRGIEIVEIDVPTSIVFIDARGRDRFVVPIPALHEAEVVCTIEAHLGVFPIIRDGNHFLDLRQGHDHLLLQQQVAEKHRVCALPVVLELEECELDERPWPGRNVHGDVAVISFRL